MNTLDTIFARHSYRGAYLDEPVPREDLRMILEAGLAAPSGCNMQTVSLIAVDDPEVLGKLRLEIGQHVGADAPAVICVLSRDIPGKGGRIYSTQDYGAAIENMLLAIVELGYQSCWIEGVITGVDRICDRMAETLGVPEEYRLVCYLPVGRAADSCGVPAKKPFEERAWYNGFGKAD